MYVLFRIKASAKSIKCHVNLINLVESCKSSNIRVSHFWLLHISSRFKSCSVFASLGILVDAELFAFIELAW